MGKYRRMVHAEEEDGSEAGASAAADFFDSNNKAAAAIRQKAAEYALIDMLKWLDEEESSIGGADSSDSEEENNHHNHHKSDSFENLHKSNSKKDLGKSESLMSFGSVNTESSTMSSEAAKSAGRIAIFDATNSTNERRKWILEMCTSPERRPGKPTGCVFVESICDDEELLMENFKMKIECSPDYKGMPFEEALADLKRRVAKYEEAYETIDDDKLSYIKVFNLSTKIMVNHCYGRMAKTIVPALMAWNIGTRPIFLCRPGQTVAGIQLDDEDYVGGVDKDAANQYRDISRKSRKKLLQGYHLGDAGLKFSTDLFAFCRQESKEFLARKASVTDDKHTGTSKTGLAKRKETSDEPSFPLQIYTSTMPRAIQTAAWDDVCAAHAMEELTNLNPLDKGDFNGKELDEIQATDPKFFSKLARDPFRTRFPGGESYFDLTRRLESVLVDLEQQVVPTLVVSHVSTLQMIIAYFRNSPVEECTDIKVPLHTVIKFTPAKGGGWSESVHPISPLESGTLPEVQSISLQDSCHSAVILEEPVDVFSSPVPGTKKSPTKSPMGQMVRWTVPVDQEES